MQLGDITPNAFTLSCPTTTLLGQTSSSSIVSASSQLSSSVERPAQSFSTSTTKPVTRVLVRSDSLKDEYEQLLPKESMDLPMSPPLSQESQDSSFGSHSESFCLHYSRPLHPFDQDSPPTRKTLNWVNALPSHFEATVPCLPRKRRRRTNREELEILEDAFARNLLPDAATRQQLGARLGMSVRAVQVWFQNRRQTLRKKSISSSTHTGSSEDDVSNSDSDSKGRIVRYRSRTYPSCDQPIMSSPALPANLRHRDGQYRSHATKRLHTSMSCPDLSACSTKLRSVESTRLRAETCMSSISTSATTASLATSDSNSTAAAQTKDAYSPTLVNIKLELSPSPSLRQTTKEEPSPVQEVPVTREFNFTTVVANLSTTVASTAAELTSSAAQSSIKTLSITDTKMADRHLSMLLNEAKKTGQGAPPVLAFWPKTSGKTVLNSSLSGPLPITVSIPQPTHRTMSAPSIKSHYNHHPSSPSSNRHSTRTSKKTRSSLFHQPSATPSMKSLPYLKSGVSLMEQVINRHQHRHQSSNFKQSALYASGKHHPSLKYPVRSHASWGVAARARVVPPAPRALAAEPPRAKSPSSTGFSPTQLAHRLQTVVRANLKRIQSESALGHGLKAHSSWNGTPIPDLVSASPSTSQCDSHAYKDSQPNTGPQRIALKARTLSFGGTLFHSDTDESPATVTSSSRHGSQSSHVLKRRAQTRISRPTVLHVSDHSSDTETDNDKTDEEVFIHSNVRREQLSKRCSSPSAQLSPNTTQKHGWHSPYLVQKRATLNQVATAPTREYGIELERSQEQNAAPSMGHTWHQPDINQPPSAVDYEACDASPDDDAVETKIDAHSIKGLNMDELECANVLAGLGWMR
ncbi:hypothetical protein BG004_006380 [Podila humilis]|nr:hypothetical protein BG004_006380 [Podila humilis]